MMKIIVRIGNGRENQNRQARLTRASQRKKRIRIVIAIVFMLAVAGLAGALLYQVTSSSEVMPSHPGNDGTVRETNAPPHGLQNQPEKIDPEGTPPLIPHEVTPDMQTEGGCLACHRHGGYASQFNEFAPVTPHPHLTDCQQCHVIESLGR